MGPFELRVSTIRDAILDRREITFSAPDGRHRLSPHVLGTRSGVWHVYGWDATAAPPDWRCIELRTITSAVFIRDGEWHRGVCPLHARQTCVDFIYAEVDPDYGPLTPSGVEALGFER